MGNVRDLFSVPLLVFLERIEMWRAGSGARLGGDRSMITREAFICLRKVWSWRACSEKEGTDGVTHRVAKA